MDAAVKGCPRGDGHAYHGPMQRARAALLVPLGLVVALGLASCAAPEPSPSTSASASRTPSPSASTSGTATPTPQATEDPGTPVEPDPEAEPLPSTDPAALDWFGLDKNAVTSSCQPALAEFFPGATIDGVPSMSGRSEETVVWFDWIVRAYQGAPDFAATCQLGLDGTSITSVFVTVQDL